MFVAPFLAFFAAGCDPVTPGDDSANGADTAAAPAVDADADGSPVGDDCDDDDATRYPAATESCNGLDDDCDGQADEDADDAADWYVDVDGDGYGGELVSGCEPLRGWTDVDGDCDDGDAAIHPAAVDPPNDGIDGDCSGADAGQWECDDLVAWPGDLLLSGAAAADDATAFCSTYNAVVGSVQIDATGLTDLEALDCLCAVGADLQVRDNASLGELSWGYSDSALPVLDSVGGDVVVSGNPQLLRVAFYTPPSGDAVIEDNIALDSAAAVVLPGSALRVADNPLLSYLYLTSDGSGAIGSLVVEDNSIMAWLLLSSLPDITRIEGDLVLTGNPALDLVDDDSVDGEGIASVSGDVRIENAGYFVDDLLLDLREVGGDVALGDLGLSYLNTGLPLETVGGDLTLSHVRGNIDFRELRSIGGSVYFDDNDGLYAGVYDTTTCPTADPIEVGGDVEASGNGKGTWMMFLCGLEELAGTVTVVGNADEVLPLGALQTVGGSVEVGYNSGNWDEACPLNAPLLEEVGGDVELLWNGWAWGDDLRCLGSLASVGGDLTIEGNQSLRSLAGLEGIRELTGALRIRDNPQLTSLSGLDGLEEVGDSMLVFDNPMLASFSGLDALRTVDGSLLLGSGPVDLEGLGSLEWVDGTFEPGTWEDVAGCSLSSLTGAGALTRAGSLQLWLCDELTTLDGLEALSTLDDDLSIYGNATLADVSALSAVTTVDDVTIEDNPSLLTTDAEALVAEFDTIWGTVSILGNKE